MLALKHVAKFLLALNLFVQSALEQKMIKYLIKIPKRFVWQWFCERDANSASHQHENSVAFFFSKKRYVYFVVRQTKTMFIVKHLFRDVG